MAVETAQEVHVMAKGLTDLVALVEEVKPLAADKPKDIIGWVTKVSALLDWLKANGWTLEDIQGIVSMGLSLWTLIEPLLAHKAVPADPQ
jgi:hypothetical protein